MAAYAHLYGAKPDDKTVFSFRVINDMFLIPTTSHDQLINARKILFI